MPSKYTDQQKQEAMQMLEIGDHIGYVHFATGIPERTLRDWRKQLRIPPDRQTAEKTFPAAAEWRQHEQAATDNKHESIESDEPVDTKHNDLENFNFIRDKLMKCARQMAANLQPDKPDINRHTLAIARVLDRIQWLDEKVLPDRIPEQTIRWEFFYDGQVHERPPWHNASD